MTNGTGQMYYLHKDHLGSLDVITNDNGIIVEEHSFDAWGRRRNPNNWRYENIAQNNLLDRGYTGHEHLDQFDLINMNGRLYDPLVARFLSPDKYVQSPDFTQSYNRYSYVFNNPLKYTDPTGWIGSNTTGGVGEFNNGMGPSWESRPPSQPYWMGLDKGLARAIEMSNRDWVNYEGARHSGGYYQREYYSTAYTTVRYDGFLNKYTQETVVVGFHFDNFYWSGSPPGGGKSFSLAGMYYHFQFGGGKPLYLSMSTVNFGKATQRDLGLTGMQSGETRHVNLFDAGPLNLAALAFGRVNMKYYGDNQFAIVGDESAAFNFVPLIDSSASTARNIGNVIGAAINYNIVIHPLAALLPLRFGGSYPVYFNGTINIPE